MGEGKENIQITDEYLLLNGFNHTDEFCNEFVKGNMLLDCEYTNEGEYNLVIDGNFKRVVKYISEIQHGR